MADELDGYAQLAAEHEDARRLFERFSETGEDLLVRQICEALTAHSHAEEECLYPLLRKYVDGGDDLADEAEQEHAAVKLIIERIELSPHDDLTEVVQELRDVFEPHATREEETLFPAMREVGIGADDLGTRLQQARGGVA